MRILRILLAVAILAYAGFLAWPVISPWFEGAGADAAATRSGAEALAVAERNLPATLLWGGAIVLYVVSALMLAGGNSRAFIAYLFGFAADAILRLAIQGGEAGDDSLARTAEAAPAGLDPVWFTLGAMVLVGALVAFASRRTVRARQPGQLTGPA